MTLFVILALLILHLSNSAFFFFFFCLWTQYDFQTFSSFLFRCNVVIHFFENALKVTVREEACDECGASQVEVGFKVILIINIVTCYLHNLTLKQMITFYFHSHV